ncbi:response regulator transcription factor [Fluviicola sp.]|uniref:response regulator transcription factor n=1 Tax=Fluviicola sp. TaxID=1917219 RepID=UPI0031E3F2E8
MTTIIVFEDKANMRESLKLLLENEPDFRVLGLFPHCVRGVEHVLQLNPDIVLMDIDLPEINGIEGTKRIKKASPDTQIVMLTVFEDDTKIFESIKAGADGYLLKKSIPSELIPAIRNTVTGGSPISPGIASRVLHAFREKSKPKALSFELSKREHEVLELLTKGYSYKKIAEHLFVSVDTIGTHIKNIYSKLQVNSASEAVAKALKNRIVE